MAISTLYTYPSRQPLLLVAGPVLGDMVVAEREVHLVPVSLPVGEVRADVVGHLGDPGHLGAKIHILHISD
ncbi:hypothetical protein PG995_014368 [Apiospora arundinis]|uniref:Uncharacterized protein n=1 Tax=Apiospora arundinis TaxID=335852 RepID=A0ABR2IIB1_9PEZI